MRGAILERFFKAADDDKTWITTVNGLTEEKFLSIISETNRWWQKVREIIESFQSKQQSNTEFKNLQ
jgi:hypothetical protein